MADVCCRAETEGLSGFGFGDPFLQDIRAYREKMLDDELVTQPRMFHFERVADHLIRRRELRLLRGVHGDKRRDTQRQFGLESQKFY